MSSPDDDFTSRGWWNSNHWLQAAAAVAFLATIAAAAAAVILPSHSASNSSAAPVRTDLTVPVPATIAFAVAVGLLVSFAFYRNVAAARRASAAQERADRALKDVVSPDDLLGFVRANASQMHAYDLLARRQAAQSHRASIVSMFVGLALVSAGVVSNAPDAWPRARHEYVVGLCTRVLQKPSILEHLLYAPDRAVRLLRANGHQEVRSGHQQASNPQAD